MINSNVSPSIGLNGFFTLFIVADNPDAAHIITYAKRSQLYGN